MNENKLLKQALKLYAGERVLKSVLELGDDAFSIGGERVSGSLVSLHIDGISSISESLTPPEFLGFLRRYLELVSKCVVENQGMICKYDYDDVLNYWEDSRSINHPDLACTAAIECKKRLEEASESSNVKPYINIGIHSDYFLIANYGSSYKLELALMGDSVNFVERLSQANKFYGTDILLSENCKSNLNSKFILREADTIRIVGNEDPITIFELLCEEKDCSSEIEERNSIYSKGLDLFKKREWKKALHEFNSSIKKFKSDNLTKTYIERCKSFIDDPPPKKWDGVYKIKI